MITSWKLLHNEVELLLSMEVTHMSVKSEAPNFDQQKNAAQMLTIGKVRVRTIFPPFPCSTPYHPFNHKLMCVTLRPTMYNTGNQRIDFMYAHTR